jgi:hypothetical protein
MIRAATDAPRDLSDGSLPMWRAMSEPFARDSKEGQLSCGGDQAAFAVLAGQTSTSGQANVDGALRPGTSG